MQAGRTISILVTTCSINGYAQDCRACVCEFMCASMHGAVSCDSSAHLPTSRPSFSPPPSPSASFPSSAALLLMWCSGQFSVDSPPLPPPLFSHHPLFDFLSLSIFVVSVYNDIKHTIHPHLYQSLSIKSTNREYLYL